MEEEKIYHYCGVETFLNIIRNHTLRLADLCSTTDNLELKCLLDTIKERVIQIYKERKDFNASVIYGMEQDNAFLFLLQIFGFDGDEIQIRRSKSSYQS